MSCLVLSLLGPFQALLDDQPLTGFRSDKSRALLAYLAAEAPRPHPRGVLAGLLWPNYPDDVALTYLRGALANLRRLLGDEGDADVPFLLVERAAIRINPAAPLHVDTAALDALDALDGPLPAPFDPQPRPHAGDHAPAAPTRAALEGAALLYRGPFLEGFALDDSPPFEEWLLLKREHYQRRALAALRRLGALALAQADYAAAARFAHRQLALESWDETAHCQLMLALALGGQRSAALAQYGACRTLLAQELGAEPSPETTDLYLRIRANHLCAPPALPSTAIDPPLTPGAPPPLLHQPVPLVARSAELARLDAALDAAPAGEGRTVFVRGDAGSGKTALIYAFGRAAALRRPLLLLLDDLQWADGGTLAWLFEVAHPHKLVLHVAAIDANTIDTYNVIRYSGPMIKSFTNQGTADVFDRLSSREARQVCPEHLWPIARRKLDLINAAISLNSLRAPPGNRLEALKHNRLGQHSIRINEKYRICFIWTDEGAEEVEIVDYR